MDLRDRTQQFAIDVLCFCEALPNRPPFWTLGRQLIRSATSVGANYRAACRARSRKEFVAKLGVVEEEADESIYWMELLERTLPDPADALGSLRKEADELTRITVASIRTAKRRM